MDVFRIQGGTPLCGEVAVSGSKNAALPIMAASILASGTVWLARVPELVDVQTLSLVLGHLGVEVKRQFDGRLEIKTVDPSLCRADYELVRRMRASFCVLGPLLARRGRAVVSLPGGCNIGDRPIDLHLRGLSALGAEIRVEHGYVVAKAKRLVGARVCLSGPQGPTVTGTANVLCAAALARGRTTITGAALEPEIVDLGRFLIALGARIDGLGTPTLEVEGQGELGGTTYTIIPDRIEAATLLLSAAITGGNATICGAAPEQLEEVLAALQRAGARVHCQGDRISIAPPARPQATNITALPYPGIPTDLQSQWMAWMARADGCSMIRDRVFSDRFRHVAELKRLGANIRHAGDVAVVSGVNRLSGAEVMASDLRASAALVLAGLAAEGETIVRRIYHLDRGYERFEAKLRGLGACIIREADHPSSFADAFRNIPNVPAQRIN
jgi:UDP-N-acetylglucosamine 1-carboxyvinyltransferase